MDDSEDRFTRHLWLRLGGFVLLPLALNALLFALYFGPWSWGHAVMVPNMTPLHPNGWREFGLLENLENLYLLAIVGGAVVYVAHTPCWHFKLFGAVVAAGALFVLLEEIDYGDLWVQVLSGHRRRAEMGEMRPESLNLHNTSAVTLKWSKRLFNFTAVALFVGIPAATYPLRKRHPTVAYLRTTGWYIIASVVIGAARMVAHGLDDAGHGFGLENNISEFAEHNAYYLAMLYFLDVFFRRRPPVLAPMPEPAPLQARADPGRRQSENGRTVAV